LTVLRSREVTSRSGAADVFARALSLALNAGGSEIDVPHVVVAIDAEAVEIAPAQRPAGNLQPVPKQELPLSARLAGVLSTFGEEVLSISVDALLAALLARSSEGER
jgi:hypothetical protein